MEIKPVGGEAVCVLEDYKEAEELNRPFAAQLGLVARLGFRRQIIRQAKADSPYTIEVVLGRDDLQAITRGINNANLPPDHPYVEKIIPAINDFNNLIHTGR